MKNFKIRTAGRVSAFFLFNFAFAPAIPAAVSPALDPAWSAPDVGVSLLRVLGALALVIGLFLAGVWLFRNGQRLAIPRGRAPQRFTSSATGRSDFCSRRRRRESVF
jgi:hypothetical protein